MTEGQKWVNEGTLFGNEIAGGDVAYVFNPEIWDLDSYSFLGFDEGGNSQGWVYFSTDMETGEMTTEEIVSWVTQKGDQTYFQPADGVSGLTVAGEVLDPAREQSVTIPEGEWIATLMNPFPMETSLANLESFFDAGDVLYVFNPEIWDLDSYSFLGKSDGWVYFSTDMESGEMTSEEVKDTSRVVLPAGVAGYYQPADSSKVHTWKVNLAK